MNHARKFLKLCQTLFSIIVNCRQQMIPLKRRLAHTEILYNHPFLLYLCLFKDVRDRSAIMVCEIKFGAKILPVYSPLNKKVKLQVSV